MQRGVGDFKQAVQSRVYADQEEHHALNMPGLVRQDSSPVPLNMSEDMSTDVPPLSPSDKKRNKLGYHRTAVACGHCRRRKIRCIPAFEDQSGRCQNCIRLKKDCHFFPVDQQSPAPGAKRTRKPNEGFIHESETSVSSSPAGGILRSSSYDQLDSGEGGMGADTLARDSPGLHYQQGSRSFSSHGLSYSHQYDPNQHQQSEELLASPYTGHSPRGYGSDATSSQYFQQYGHPLQGSYHPSFSPGSLPSNSTGMSQESAYTYPAAASNGYQWGQNPQQLRSMSTGEHEDLAHGFPHAYRTNTYPSFERRMTGDMQQIPTTGSGYMPMSMESQSSSIPAQFREPSSYQPMNLEMQQDWPPGGQPSHMTGPNTASYSSSWYPQQGLAGLREGDEHAHILPSQDRQIRRGGHKPG